MSCNGRYTRQQKYGDTLAPVKLVRFLNPLNELNFVEIEALLDSGASATFIPKKVAEDLALVEMRKSPTYDYQRKSTGLKPVYAVIVSCDSMSNVVEAIETDGFPIIGRDVLNTTQLTLNGPQQRWAM